MSNGYTGNAAQGRSVALSVDGNVLVLGGPQDVLGIGAVWAFTRTDGLWTQQCPKLVGSDTVGNAQQGIFVALSADGNTLAIGGPGDTGGQGTVWMFARIGGLWIQMGSKLVGAGADGNAQQGISVALSADGNTLAEGGYLDNAVRGAVWVFV